MYLILLWSIKLSHHCIPKSLSKGGGGQKNNLFTGGSLESSSPCLVSISRDFRHIPQSRLGPSFSSVISSFEIRRGLPHFRGTTGLQINACHPKKVPNPDQKGRRVGGISRKKIQVSVGPGVNTWQWAQTQGRAGVWVSHDQGCSPGKMTAKANPCHPDSQLDDELAIHPGKNSQS